MSDGIFILVPLLVLPIILLFRFVGCGLETKGEERVTSELQAYRDIILAESGVVAYWRLVDAEGTTKAKDEWGSLDGEYITPGFPYITPGFPNVEPGIFPGSEGASGEFTMDGSLIEVDPAECRAFSGGYVVVEGFAKKKPSGFAEVEYPSEFTVEAWISPVASDNGLRAYAYRCRWPIPQAGRDGIVPGEMAWISDFCGPSRPVAGLPRSIGRHSIGCRHRGHENCAESRASETDASRRHSKE